MEFANRETWLEAAISTMRPWFDDMNQPLPERVLISCGWPRNQGGKAKPVGQAFDPVLTTDGSGHIFICPTVAEPVRVLDIVLHECCHLAVGVGVGHSGPFVTLIRAFGLVGKATQTRAESGSALYERLLALAGDLGPYPHSPVTDIRLGSPRPPGGGWVKLWSVTLRERYILRVSPKSLAEYGPPLDPFGQVMVPPP